MQRSINIILIVLIIVAAGVLAYYLIQPEPESQLGLAPAGFAGAGGVSDSALRNQEFIDLLRDLKQTNIERSFFDTTLFQSLREFGRPLAPQPKGRTNPFAPLGQGNISSGGQATTENQPAVVPEVEE